MNKALAIVYVSQDGETDWQLVKPEDVPEWVKDPEVMGNLLRGQTARKESPVVLPDGSPPASPWYRATRADELERVGAAQNRRARRQRRNIALEPPIARPPRRRIVVAH